MRALETTAGRLLYVGHAIRQIDGGVRYLCAETEAGAEQIAEAIRLDPAMVDGVECIPVAGAARR